MHPFSYANIFVGDVPVNPAWTVFVVALMIFGACFLALVILSITVNENRPLKRWVALTARIATKVGFTGLILTLIAMGICLVVITSMRDSDEKPYQIQLDNMNANLTQKYHATLIDPTRGDYPNDSLISGDSKFNLALPNGKQGIYNIKWDKDTSEPTIIDKTPPSPQELNQTATKQ